MGARFRSSSDGDGQGAVFTVKLPLVGCIPETADVDTAKLEEETASLGRLKSQQLLSGLHVLLVDDDQDTLDLLSAALNPTKREGDSGVIRLRGLRINQEFPARCANFRHRHAG